jgi:hypothetical protein
VQRIRASITYLYGGSPGVITLYTKTEGPENDASAVLCGDRLKNALIAGQDLFQTNTSFTSDPFVDTLDPVTGEITGSDSYTPWTVVGTQSMGALPPANAVVVSWKTAGIVNGRRVRGRTFLSPLDNSTADSAGTPSSSALTHANALATAWQDAGLTSTSTCVWHRPVSGAGGSDWTIIGATVKDKFGVLRSRRD